VKTPLFRTLFACFFIIGGAIFYSPVISGQKGRPEVSLSLRQRTEILFHNGVRNAQRQGDVYAQIQTLKKTVDSIARLRSVSAAQTPKDEKAINQRVKQLKSMIVKHSVAKN
jgi:hypothetical protein